MKGAGEAFKGEDTLSRKAAIYLSHRYSGRTLKEIGRHFGISELDVS